MQIEMEKIHFGVTLGFKLGRLEFIWGANIPEAINAFDESKNEILRMTSSDNIIIDNQNFVAFSSSILNYYMTNDIETFFSILIGFCLQRSSLSQQSPNSAQLNDLAKTCLNAVPEAMIGNKYKFFSFIQEQCTDSFNLFSAAQNIYAYINNLSSSKPSFQSTQYQIFISYRRDGGDALAGRLADRFTALGYKVFYDVESMRSGAFNTQILDALAQCNDVLLVLPPNALDRCVNPDDWVRQELAFALQHDKNIIPIMMRGFEFPEKLPADIDRIRYMEGVSASSEYFDACIKRLEQLLVTTPH